MKTKFVLANFLFFLLVLSGCQKEKDLVPPSASNPHVLRSIDEPNCETDFNLMAGQTFVAGQVRILSDDDSIYVGYVTEGWTIIQTHLFIGNCRAIPLNTNGSPAPGRFPIFSTFTAGTTQAWYSFPLSSLPQCGCIAAHAVVMNNVTGRTETGWSEGTRFTNGNWAMRSEYCLCDRVPISTTVSPRSED